MLLPFYGLAYTSTVASSVVQVAAIKMKPEFGALCRERGAVASLTGLPCCLWCCCTARGCASSCPACALTRVLGGWDLANALLPHPRPCNPRAHAAGGHGAEVLGLIKGVTQLVQDTSELVLIVFAAWTAINLKDRLVAWLAASLRGDGCAAGVAGQERM